MTNAGGMSNNMKMGIAVAVVLVILAIILGVVFGTKKDTPPQPPPPPSYNAVPLRQVLDETLNKMPMFAQCFTPAARDGLSHLAETAGIKAYTPASAMKCADVGMKDDPQSDPSLTIRMCLPQSFSWEDPTYKTPSDQIMKPVEACLAQMFNKPGAAAPAPQARGPQQVQAQPPPVQYVPPPGPGPAPALAVQTPGATFYTACNFQGQSSFFGPGNYPRIWEAGFPNDALSSLKVTPGTKVFLYKHDYFNGASIQITSDNACLSSDMLRQASSFKVV
jgi:hypothetical protein